MKLTQREKLVYEDAAISILENDCCEKIVTGTYSYYRCPNDDCNCDTILRSYNYCPLCGFPIDWIEGNESEVSESDDYGNDPYEEEDEK